MGEIVEEIKSGFCKARNQTRTIFCEYEEQEDGRLKLMGADCFYGICEHTADCLLMNQKKNT